MDNYLILMYLLFTLAAIDLVVGVSNDAVNFLNSAIGSKVASFKTILLVASIGILVGASFSSGMMEVARKGIFNPGFFTFEMIMYVFMAVMLTDIILLDFYNTVGLPTSTTVSIVFELLGAALAVGLLFAFSTDRGLETAAEIINYESAITIISGIFLSILISFSIGSLIQYVTRLAFSFNFEQNMKRFGPIFSGIAITSITYFLLIKGAKGSTFDSSLEWITKSDTLTVLVVSFLFWALVTWLTMKFTKINPLKIVVLMGTFALAMAFAGNDLVNFIGVAIAGKQSYAHYVAEGGLQNLNIAESLNMTFLSEKQATNSWLLVGAGIIMVATLWFSAKAKKVTETEVGLSRQDDGDEKFRSNLISRGIVGAGMSLGKGFRAMMSENLRTKLDRRFEKGKADKNVDERDAPAFDLLRATVNLMVASIVISYATSLKLPLSTTYVSFMVAMGTSLADKAWGRESAVYRVAGVVNVIGGWLLTALIAFVTAAAFGAIIFYGKFPAIYVLTAFAAFMLIRSHISFSRKSKEDAESKDLFAKAIDIENVIDESKINTAKNLDIIRKSTSLSLKSMVGENKDIMVRSFKQLEKLHTKNDKLQGKIIKYIRKMEPGHMEAGRLYILVFDLMQDLSQSASLLSSTCTNHLINHHEIPSRVYLDVMVELDGKLNSYLNKLVQSIDNLQFADYDTIVKEKVKIIEFLNDKIDDQIREIQTGNLSSRNGLLQTRILLETKDIVEVSSKVLGVYVDYARIA
jgi:phosphate/sulfate permease